MRQLHRLDRTLRCATLVSMALAAAAPASALNILLNDVGGAAPGSQARIALEAAAALWEAALLDPVDVRIDVSYQALAPSVLGASDARELQFIYDTFTIPGSQLPDAVKPALTADQTSLDDASAVASLQPGVALDFVTQNETGAREFDGNPPENGAMDDRLDNGGINNLVLQITTANAKAMGLQNGLQSGFIVPVEDGSTADGTLDMNSTKAWDFDPTDGIDPGTFDFVGVAAHEMGHVLGFSSGVDVVAQSIQNGTPLDDASVLRSLDLFRFSAVSIGDEMLPGFACPLCGPGVLDLSVGGAPYFSVDGGLTNLGLLSTGPAAQGGDGFMAGHWKDDDFLGDVSLGVMNAASAGGETLLPLSELDLKAFDAIGWDRADTVGLGRARADRSARFRPGVPGARHAAGDRTRRSDFEPVVDPSETDSSRRRRATRDAASH